MDVVLSSLTKKLAMRSTVKARETRLVDEGARRYCLLKRGPKLSNLRLPAGRRKCETIKPSGAIQSEV